MGRLHNPGKEHRRRIGPKTTRLSCLDWPSDCSDLSYSRRDEFGPANLVSCWPRTFAQGLNYSQPPANLALRNSRVRFGRKVQTMPNYVAVATWPFGQTAV